MYLGKFSLTGNEQIWLLAFMMYIMTLILVRSKENFFFYNGETTFYINSLVVHRIKQNKRLLLCTTGLGAFS